MSPFIHFLFRMNSPTSFNFGEQHISFLLLHNNYQKCSGLEQHPFIIPQFWRTKVNRLTWVLCSGSQRVKIKLLTRLGSHLEAHELLVSFLGVIQGYPQFLEAIFTLCTWTPLSSPPQPTTVPQKCMLPIPLKFLLCYEAEKTVFIGLMQLDWFHLDNFFIIRSTYQ